METCDFRIAHARQFLAAARGRKPADLLPDDLVCEITELRRCLAWAIDVVDDFAATELDENVTQVTLWGGLYVAPADVAVLCGRCLRLLVSEQHPHHLASAGSAAAWQT
jgi:hypothetical protein